MCLPCIDLRHVSDCNENRKKVGRRITKAARKRYREYLESGNSKELYTVLMALSTPSQKRAGEGGGEGGADSDDDDDDGEEEDEEEEDEDEGEEDEDEEGTIDSEEDASEGRLEGKTGVESASGGVGPAYGGGVKSPRAPPLAGAGRGRGQGGGEACDAPES